MDGRPFVRGHVCRSVLVPAAERRNPPAGSRGFFAHSRLVRPGRRDPGDAHQHSDSEKAGPAQPISARDPSLLGAVEFAEGWNHASTFSFLARAPRLCVDFLVTSHFHWCCDRNAHESFLSCFSRNERAQQRRRERKIAQNFKRSRVECFSAKQIERLVQDAEQVAKKSYQHSLNVGFSDSPEIRARLEYDAMKGWLAGYILYLDEEPCAFWIGSLRNGVFLSNYLAFDPAYRQYSPGMYLMIRAMEALSSESRLRADRIDFGVGDAVYKRRLSNHNREEALLHLFAPRPGPILGNLLHSTMGFFRGLAKRLWTWSGAMRSARVAQAKPLSL